MLDLAYSLEAECPIPWNPTQESNLHHDYPLAVDDETTQGFVIRRYLETSISSLAHLITSLQRVQPPSTTQITTGTAVHPLHECLDPLLLSVKMCSEKYRSELPLILVDGGGAGELEESMMWYAWNYGKEPEEAASSSSQQKDKTKEDIWKAKWLEKLERRETMIQILLYLLKISLPGPCPAPSFISPPEESTTSPSKKRKRPRQERKAPVELLEEQLELYMDKLSSWQLMDSINPQHARDLSFMDIAIAADSKGKPKDDRHWTVAFSQEIVDIFFKDSLPLYCTLLRSKLLPQSTFDEDSDDSPLSPTSTTSSRAIKRTNSTISGKSPSRTRSNSRAPTVEAESSHQRNGGPSRSRSLSVSLAEDEDRQRRAMVGPKRMLSREISMSRTFKEKARAKKSDLQESASQPQRKSSTAAPPKPALGVTLIQETPIRRPSTSVPELRSYAKLPRISGPLFIPDSDDDVIVEDTPIRPKESSSSQIASRSFADLELEEDDDDDEFTDSFGSPNILMLGDNELSQRQRDVDIVLDTPTRARN